VGTDSDRTASSLLSRLEEKKQERWEEAVISVKFSHSSRQAWRTINKLLAGLDAPLTSAPSQQTPSPRNSWRMGHTGPAIASPPGWSTRSCPTYGRFQPLRFTVSLNPLGRISLLQPSDDLSQESLRDWIQSSRSSYSTLGRLWNLGFANSLVLTCANSKFQRSGEKH